MWYSYYSTPLIPSSPLNQQNTNNIMITPQLIILVQRKAGSGLGTKLTIYRVMS